MASRTSAMVSTAWGVMYPFETKQLASPPRRARWAVSQASSKKILTSKIGPEETRLFTCPAGEHRNFLDCVKSRRDPYFPAEIGNRCCSVAHIGNIALDVGRKLRWNPETEEFVDDAMANRLRSRAMREPWTI